MLHALLLAVALSPYLASHSSDAVKWNSWGDAAIARAQREHKPLFVSIGYASCHWCHVMQRESFADAEVSKLLNEQFVPVLVDREEHPDVDAALMTYVELLNNGAGGWPANLVLTPQLEPVAGATYLPRASLVELLEVSSRKWTGDREALRAEAASVIASAREFAKVAAAPPAEALTLAAFVERARAAHDAKNGGFGTAPKFPQALLLDFLLRESVRTNDASLRELATSALDAMASGAIYDRERGGFHRYTTDAAWQQPHYEKMLFDQALLADDYLTAFQLTNNARYATIARATLDFMLRDLRVEGGGFASSLDADDRARRDDKVIAAWNGLAIAALARAGAALDEPRYIDAAATAAQFIETKLWDGKRLARRWHRGDASIDGVAEDYASVIGGLIELYEGAGPSPPTPLPPGEGGRRPGEGPGISGTRTPSSAASRHLLPEGEGFVGHWLRFATQLQQRQDALFWRESRYVSSTKLPPQLASAIDESDVATPSANSQSALNLLRLGDLTDNAKYRDRAATIIATFSSRLASASMPALASALSRSLTPERQLMIAGDLRNATTRALLRVAHERFDPNLTILFKPAKRPAAFLCEHYVCKLPIYDPAELASTLARSDSSADF